MNGDGKISWSKQGAIMGSLGHSELHKMLKELDADGDGDGKISFLFLHGVIKNERKNKVTKQEDNRLSPDFGWEVNTVAKFKTRLGIYRDHKKFLEAN